MYRIGNLCNMKVAFYFCSELLVVISMYVLKTSIFVLFNV
jgi:hypothetical protein